jgi:hypothetical protein
MLSANLPLFVNILIFVAYFFVTGEESMAWPDRFVVWPWLLFGLHVYLHHFFDGLQNAARNIVRIYLIREYGPHYQRQLVTPIQTALVPDSVLPAMIIWWLSHIGSFAGILFFQGWGTALVTELSLMIFGGLIPIHYAGHLRRLRRHAAQADVQTSLAFTMSGVSIRGVADVAEQALLEGRDPQQWWGAVLRDAIIQERAARENDSPDDESATSDAPCR